MTTAPAVFLYGLHEVQQALKPIIAQRMATLDPAMVEWAGRTAFSIRHASHRLIQPLKGQILTVEDHIFAAWIVHFFYRDCFLDKRSYLEYLFADLFVNDGHFLNEAQYYGNVLLGPLYWLASPETLSQDHPIHLSMRGTVLYVEGNLSPLATVPSWAYRPGHPQE